MTERTNDVERDELVARLADAVLARTEAESNLRVRARMHASYDEERSLENLIEAARRYHVASEAEEGLQRGEPIELIWGRGLVMGEAIGIANEIRDRRINALRTASNATPEPLDGDAPRRRAMSGLKFDLAALKAKGLPRCTFATLSGAMGLRLVPEPGSSPEEVAAASAELHAAIDAQVHPFIPPQKECIGCGKILAAGDMVEAFLLATFTYGLQHGEGFCRNCGYPARANHYAPKDGSGLTFVRVLQYHPDELEERQPAKEVER